MKQFFTFSVFLLLSLIGFSQVELDVNTKDYVTGKKLSGVEITVYEGSTVVKNITTTSNGNAKINLPAGKVYKMEFSKPGKVNRFMTINTKGIDVELIQGANVVKTKFEVSLFDEIANVDYSYIENNPITEYYFDGSNPEMQYDNVLASKMAKKIETLIAEADKKASENEAKYQDAVSKADTWYKQNKYKEALSKYEEANLLKPKEPYPIEKIKELDGLIKAQQNNDLAEKQKEEQYKALIASADALRDQKKYPEAIAKYNEALKIKNEQYAKDQIVNVNKLVEAEKAAAALEANYQNIVKAADALAAQKSYGPAKDKYNEALKIKPSDEAVKKKIVEMDNKLKEEALLAEKNKKYNDVITQADQLLTGNKLVEAKVKYNEAMNMDNTKPYPKEKIKEIDDRIANEAKDKEKKAKYDAAMKMGNDFMTANKLTEAKTKFNEAAGIDPAQTLPKEKIAQIDKLISDQAEAAKNKEKAAKIAELLKTGSTLLAKNDLNNAKAKYTEVLGLDPSNAEATTKLAEINTKISQQQSQAQKDEAFAKLKAQGNELMLKEDWNGAKLVYTEAKGIKADAEVDSKLKEIETKIAADGVFNKLVQEAKALEATNVDGAIAKYKEASAKKPKDENVKKKIADLEKVKANQANQAEVNKKYDAVMKKANDAFAAKKYLDAIKFYNEALAIKPDQKEPVDKAEEARALAQNDKSDKEKAYQKILDTGQKSIEEKNWTKAKEMYNRALTLKPEDLVPKDKLKEIDRLIKEEEQAKLSSIEKDKAYTKKMEEAELLASKKDYDKAISSFTQAQSIKPEEKLPAKRIQEINELKAQANGSVQNEKMYQDYMKNGLNAQTAKNYTQALSEYKNALTVKSNDKAALAKIAEVEKLIDEETNKQSAEKTKEEFNRLVKEGDALFSQEKWKEARQSYESALAIDSRDFYSQKQVKKCIEKMKSQDDGGKQYQKLISKADENFRDAKYDKAKELYERALTLKANDQYPKDKLNEIESILNPVVIVPPGPLNSLGIPTTEDPEKVQEALIKADLERKNRKNVNLKNKSEGIQNQNSASSTEKSEEILNSVNTISNIEKQKSENYVSGDDNRQKLVEKINQDENNLDVQTAEAYREKSNENNNLKETINKVEDEMGKNYSSSEQVYTENTDVLKTDKNDLQQVIDLENKKSYESNIQSQQELTKTGIKIEEKYEDDFDSRKSVERSLTSTKDSISITEVANNEKESDNISNLAVKMLEEDKVRVAKTVEDSKVSGYNDEDLKLIEKAYNESSGINVEKSIDKSLEADKIINQNQNGFNKVTLEQDGNRIENVEKVKSGSNTIEDNMRSEYNKNIVKHLNTEDLILDRNIKNNEIVEREKIKADDRNAVLEDIDKKAKISVEEKFLSDEEERQRTKNDVNNVQVKVSKNELESGEKVDNNISNMKIVTTDLEDQRTTELLSKKEELNNSQTLLDKISAKEVKFTDKVANEVGALYPEGVSQEVFENKDEDGLLIAVVTRRVVVKNGYGQIYVRTQSLTGLTYSKNGNPSSEFVWQKETQDAKLQKNF